MNGLSFSKIIKKKKKSHIQLYTNVKTPNFNGVSSKKTLPDWISN